MINYDNKFRVVVLMYLFFFLSKNQLPSLTFILFSLCSPRASVINNLRSPHLQVLAFLNFIQCFTRSSLNDTLSGHIFQSEENVSQIYQVSQWKKEFVVKVKADVCFVHIFVASCKCCSTKNERVV